MFTNLHYFRNNLQKSNKKCDTSIDQQYNTGAYIWLELGLSSGAGGDAPSFSVGTGSEVNDPDEVLLRLEEEAVVGAGFTGDSTFNSESANRLIWCITPVKWPCQIWILTLIIIWQDKMECKLIYYHLKTFRLNIKFISSFGLTYKYLYISSKWI